MKWPSADRKREIKTGFYEKGGFPGVIGCIDGTHVRIQAPSHDEPSYVNRKGFHSINVQAICDNEGNTYKKIISITHCVKQIIMSKTLQYQTHYCVKHITVSSAY